MTYFNPAARVFSDEFWMFEVPRSLREITDLAKRAKTSKQTVCTTMIMVRRFDQLSCKLASMFLIFWLTDVFVCASVLAWRTLRTFVVHNVRTTILTDSHVFRPVFFVDRLTDRSDKINKSIYIFKGLNLFSLLYCYLRVSYPRAFNWLMFYCKYLTLSFSLKFNDNNIFYILSSFDRFQDGGCW